jgi:glutathione synthase/RimK-type ligase-like ATP-grasp enzyme
MVAQAYATRRRTRILLSEGASTSARQAITALAAEGYEVEICDPHPFCLGRFSRLVRRYHRCPAMGADPEKYLSFVLAKIAAGEFDVLLPIHEQGFLFARAYEQIAPHVSVALPSFESYEQVHSKAGFSRLLSALDLPQPETRLLESARNFPEGARFPFVLKAPIGTASRGTWVIFDAADLEHAIAEIHASGVSREPLLIQEFVAGPLEHAQAVFSRGRLVGHHTYRQIVRGVGGGPAVKESIRRPLVRRHLERIGEHLDWHGALSVDYIVEESTQTPLYIDCNPRLVEPMSASLAGLNLAHLLVRVSKEEAPEAQPEGREGVRTHMAIQALLGCAARSGSRWRVLVECWRLLAKRHPYAGSVEELTPVRLDPSSALPVAVTALWLLAHPKAAHYLPRTGWGAHLLTAESARKIRSWSFNHQGDGASPRGTKA